MRQITTPHTKYILAHTSFAGEQERYVVSGRDIIAQKLPYTIERKKDSHGVFFKLNVNNVIFTGQTASWLRQKFESRGIQTDVTLEVSVLVNGRYRSFEPKKLDFTKARFSEARGEIKLGLLDSSFIEESEKAKDKKAQVTPNRKIILRGQEIEFTAKGYIDSFFADAQVIDTADYPYQTPPFAFETREINEVLDAFSTPSQPCYINRSNTEASIALDYSLQGVMRWNIGGTITSGTATTYVDISVITRDALGSTIATSSPARAGSGSFGSGTSGTVSTPFAMQTLLAPILLVVPPGGSIGINIEFNASAYNPTFGSVAVEYENDRDANYLTLTDQTPPKDSTSDAVTIFSAFSQVLQGRFKSDYFDTGGCGANLVLVKGAWIRKLDKDLHLSFDELFQNLSKVLNLGYGYEKVAGEWRIRVEPIEYFYNTNSSPSVVLSSIDKYSLEKTVSLDFAYSSIQVGYKYKNKEYNITNAATQDFHTQRRYETPLVGIVKKELNLVSDFVTSGFAVAAQKKRLEVQTEDSNLDSEVFIVSLAGESSNESRQAEGYTNVSGIFATNTVMNLDLSPTRNFLRHYSLVASVLQKTHSSEKIIFAGGERNTSLVTTTSNTCQHQGSVSENADWDSKGVIELFFTNEKYTLKGVKGFSQLESILANPNSPIAFTDAKNKEVEGFVIRIQGEDLRCNNFSLELLEKYKN